MNSKEVLPLTVAKKDFTTVDEVHVLLHIFSRKMVFIFPLPLSLEQKNMTVRNERNQMEYKQYQAARDGSSWPAFKHHLTVSVTHQ